MLMLLPKKSGKKYAKNVQKITMLFSYSIKSYLIFKLISFLFKVPIFDPPISQC